MDLKPECKATAIGSFPHEEAGAALDDVLKYLTDIPVWPQLPARGFVEGMCPQYSQGLPAVHIEPEEKKIWVDTGADLPAHVEKFYEIYLAEELEPLAVSADYAPGLHEFVDRLQNRDGEYAAVKGHITGPITWGLTVCDQDQKASFYDDMYKDAMVKALARKAQWQVRFLQKVNPRVIIFIDEPYLQSIGSAAMALNEDDVAQRLNEVIEDIHKAGALAGIHCCGNTDWSLLARTDTDIVNFDAFQYAEALSLYPRQIGEFLDKDGILAWGIVPSTGDIDDQDADKLINALRRAMSLLEKRGIKQSLLLERALITPSCGGGSLTVPQSRKMLRLTAEVSGILRGAK